MNSFKKKILYAISHLKRYFNTLVLQLITREKISQICEINIYIKSDLRDSIEKRKPFRGNKRQQVKLRRFIRKKREFFKKLNFLSVFFKINNSSKKIYDTCVTMSAEKFISLATSCPRAEDGALLVRSKSNQKITWKIYIKNIDEEPEEYKGLGSIGCTISNSL